MDMLWFLDGLSLHLWMDGYDFLMNYLRKNYKVRQKYIPEDTDGFSKFKETTNSVEQQLKRERLIQRKSGLKKMELERMWAGGKQKKKDEKAMTSSPK